MTGPGRIGIVYPYGNLDSVPSLRSAAVLLAQHGYWVDIYTQLDDAHLPPAFDHERISVLPAFERLATMGFGRLMPGPIYRPFQALRRHRAVRYLCIIGVDPAGLVCAKSLARWVRAPLAYYSLELLLSYEVNTDRDQELKAQEIALSREAAFVIIQDDERAELLARDNGLATDRIITVPNAPLGTARREPSDFLRKRFNLSEDTTIVLHAGSIADWACTHQLIESTHDWPDDWVLIFHTRQRVTQDSPLLATILPHLVGTQRVLLSTDPVPHDEYPSLVQSAGIGIAFYCTKEGSTYTQDNIRYIGLSSGKLAYYLQYGLPVVVSEISSLRRLTATYGCGEVAKDPSLTRASIERILSNYDRYSQGAIACFNREFDFVSRFKRVLKVLDRL